MKPKLSTSALLFVSAYAPLALILAIKDFDFKKAFSFKHPIEISILVFLSILSVIFLFILVRNLNRGNKVVKVKSVKYRSIDLINYIIPYIVSFFNFDLSKMEDVVSLGMFLLLMFLLTLKSNSIFMNPMLLLAGYNLYDLEYEFDSKSASAIVISKFEMRNNERYYIHSINKFLYFVTAKKEEHESFNETKI